MEKQTQTEMEKQMQRQGLETGNRNLGLVTG
jgi:hypothetical protein